MTVPADAPLAAVLRLHRAHAAVTARLGRDLSAHHGVSLDDLVLLLHLRGAPDGTALADLAAAAGISPAAAARALAPMEKIGLVVRDRGTGGARGARASLTPAGRERVDDASRSLSTGAMRMVGERMDRAEALALADLLGRLAPDGPGDLAAGV